MHLWQQIETIIFRGSIIAFFVAISDRADLPAIDAAAQRGERPRHAMVQLTERLSGEIVQPPIGSVSLLDRLAARLIGKPQHWAMARALRARLTGEDVLYATDEASGLPIAALCGGGKRGPKIVVLVHNINRPRARLALRLFGLDRKVDRFLAVSGPQVDTLQRLLPRANAAFLSDQTDLAFFQPGEAPAPPRPVIMSVGLEQRDYRTLAQAAADLPVDVRISGFSTDAIAVKNAFPAEMPANMTRDFYEWRDLRALYRSASVVVVSLFPNTYAAGIQVLLEAVACRRPVIVTRTEGLRDYLDRPDLITTIPSQDAAAMRAAITAKLADPAAAQAQAEAAFAHFRDRISSEVYIETVSDLMKSLTAQ